MDHQNANQIMQMTQFILNEAKDKAEEIDAKALQEFSVEKTKFINQTKDKMAQEFARKSKVQETQIAIARSTAINKARLEKVRARQDVLGNIQAEAKTQIDKELQAADKNKAFITNLIVQGMLMLLESNVEVRCREVDQKVVESCFDAAKKEYARVVKEEAGIAKTCELSLDKTVKLAPPPSQAKHGLSCLGGVVLACQNASITIDNTIDSRLDLVIEQAKPTIRKLLFEDHR